MTTLNEIVRRLDRIEHSLSRLVAPVAAEEGRQLATATDEQRKAHNRLVLGRARSNQKRRGA